MFDPVNMIWTDLSASAAVEGILPAARFGHGFTAISGRLYIHGGAGAGGEHCVTHNPLI